jgi:integrase/DNA-binding XRE family transcriptional regulator
LNFRLPESSSDGVEFKSVILCTPYPPPIQLEDDMKFTKRAVEAIEATNKRQHFFDEEFTGFALRVSEAGRKSFYYTYRAGKGRGQEKKWVMLGAFPSMTVEQAREKCKALAANVQNGIDPSLEIRETKNAIIISDALDQFDNEYVAKLKPRSIEFYQMTIRKHLKPHFGKIKAKDLGYSEIARFHTSMKDTPYAANRSVNILSVFLNWCELHGYRERQSNPCQKVPLYKEHKRQEFMDETVLTTLGETLSMMEGNWIRRKETGERRKSEHVDTMTPHAAAAIRLLMFTGARRSEILTLKWSYINFELGIARLPDSKTGFKVLQLPAPALAVLHSLPQVSEYVFPGDSKTGHMVCLKNAWRDVCLQADLQGWRIHDLRHAFASVMVNSGASLPIIGKILGHTQASTTQRYAHLQENPARRAAEDAAAKIAALAATPGTKTRPAKKADLDTPAMNTLKGSRIKAGLSQKQLAERSGVTFQSISALENDQRSIGKAMAKRLAPALEIDWTALAVEKRV